jgi:hypothetical protein
VTRQADAKKEKAEQFFQKFVDGIYGNNFSLHEGFVRDIMSKAFASTESAGMLRKSVR